MKIAVIMGSPRKRDSFEVCKMLEEKIKMHRDLEFEYVYLNDLNISDCKGCDQCFKRGEQFCPIKDDIPEIRKKLVTAAGIIFTSPVYAYQVTGAFKRFVDRMAFMFHRPELVGKPAMTLVTTGGAGQKPVTKYLKMVACGWGCNLTSSIEVISFCFSRVNNKYFSKNYFDSKKQELEKRAEEFLTSIESSKLPKPSYYQLYMFHGLKSKTLNSTADYNYWREKGWLTSSYYYATKLSPLKRLFGTLFDALVRMLWKKYQNGSESLSQ